MKLGCLTSKKHDPQRFALAPRLADFCDLPLLADSCHYAKHMSSDWGMMLNDQLGDCVIAARYHLLQLTSGNVGGSSYTASDDQVLADYSAVTGYDPTRPDTDQGTIPLDALRYWARKGEILTYGLVDFTNDAHMAAALQLFGGLFAAYDLPDSWVTESTWDATASQAVGGHMVAVVGHDRKMTMPVVTWGGLRQVTKRGHHQRCAECWVIVDKSWLGAGDRTIQGLDLAGLVAAAKAID